MKRHYDKIQERSCQIATLIFKDQRFEVDKQKLTQKCQYFAALSLPKFRKHYQVEHEIHVGYSLEVFQVSFIPLIQKEHHRVNCLIVLSVRYFVLRQSFSIIISYEDFVLMCLANTLLLKTNFLCLIKLNVKYMPNIYK